jgi:hypothetical protein
VIKAESDAEREKTVRFFRESMSNRLNDEQSAIVIIMQRLHENDVSGGVLNREADYCHLMIPIYFDPFRFPASVDGTVTEDPETWAACRLTQSANIGTSANYRSLATITVIGFAGPGASDQECDGPNSCDTLVV